MQSSFFDDVYKVACQIPNGRVTTYAAIAKYLGTAKAARMVGWAMNKCSSYKKYVPAHRVVNRKGVLTGKHYFDGENTMKELLSAEGIEIIDNQIQHLERYFWDPAKELNQ